MRRRRVSSPSAANTGAAFRSADVFSGACFETVLSRGDMVFDPFHLFVPAFAVQTKSIQST